MAKFESQLTPKPLNRSSPNLKISQLQ